MSNEQAAVLPYRTTGDDLVRLVEACARGRDWAQIQALNFSAPGFQGTLVAATALGMLDPDSKELSESGREFALADAEQRKHQLLRGMKAYNPYGLLLEAVFGRPDPAETPLDWILTWWATHDFGNSQTNRDEGSAAFAKFVEYVGLGAYVPGRRGHPTRIRWHETAEAAVRGRAAARQPHHRELSLPRGAAPPPAPAVERVVQAVPVAAPVREGSAAPRPPAGPPKAVSQVEGRSSMVLTLGPGRTVDLSVPAQVTAAEKQRLISLINLFISTPEME